MALTDKLTAIADAIREKTGKTNTMLLADMPEEIANIKSEALLKPGEYPDYVRTEIMRVANNVRKVLTDDSFVSICTSDTHYPADTATQNGVLHGMMAIKGLSQVLPVDFIAHLGDLSYDQYIDMSTLQNNHVEILSYLKEQSSDSIPLFVAIGNHDSGVYITKNDMSDQLSGDWLYDHFTSLSNSSNTIMSGQSTGGYCYRDFPNKKIRVFLLNTSENIITGGEDNGTSATQRAWVASKLQELNTKTDASDWGFVVLCHYPLDYGASKNLSDLFAAYVNGTSITLNGTSYNFSGKNTAKFLIQFHGHIHNFLIDKLYTGPLGNHLNGNPGTQYNAYRMAIPNGQSNRENYYYYTNSDGSTNSSSDGTMWGIKFFEGTYSQKGEDGAWHKSTGTEKDTSLVVNVINPSEEKIYSFAYGAGYDRALGIGDITYYSITRNLTNVTLSNNITSIEENQPYYTTISYPENYILTITVSMNGNPVALDENGAINIPNVTGPIIINAEAYAAPTTNLGLIAYDFTEGSREIYNNGLGYIDDYRLHGNYPHIPIVSTPGYVTTGCIPWEVGNSIIFSGAELPEGDSMVSMLVLEEYRNTNDFPDSPNRKVDSPWVTGYSTFAQYFTITKENGVTTLTMTNNGGWSTTGQRYITMTLKGNGRDLIIDTGTEIGDIFSITNNLTNITTNNNSTSIAEGANYTATLTPISNYKVTNVIVTMGGITVENAYNSSTGIITVNNVTGNIVITATATQAKTYTITYNLTNVTSSDTSTSIIENHSYTTDLIVNNGCTMSTVKITMGGIDITNNVLTDDFIAIGSVTGNIVITATATLNNYTITNTLTKVTNSNTATSINHGSQYSATLTPTSGYKLSSVTVKMSGTDITSTAYSGGKINISSVTGNIIITAIAIAATYTVTYDLTRASSSNTNTAVSGSGYTTTLTANDNCVLDSVVIKMGGTDITSSAYTSSTGVVNIATVTGDIIISVVAGIYNYIRLAVDRPDGTLGIGENGYKAGLRFSSGDGYSLRSDANYCSTGFIEVPARATIRIKNATLASSSTTNSYINLYTYKAIGTTITCIKYDELIANTTNGITTITIADSSMKYITLCCAKIDDSTIITVNRPIT